MIYEGGIYGDENELPAVGFGAIAFLSLSLSLPLSVLWLDALQNFWPFHLGERKTNCVSGTTVYVKTDGETRKHR